MGTSAGDPPVVKPVPLPEAIAKAHRWRRWIIVLGILLPLIAIIECLVVSFLKEHNDLNILLGREIVPLGSPASFWRPKIPGAVFLYALYIVADWPFLLIAEASKRRILKLWPDMRAARLAIYGAIAGLIFAYAPLYARLGLVTVLDPRKALFANAVFCLAAPFYAWALAGVGWFFGHWIDRRTATVIPPVAMKPQDGTP
jgi:hypothetical protein